MTSKPESEPIAPDERLLAAHDLALAALHEITPAETVGDAAGYTVEDDGVVSMRFLNRLSGYPGWFWTVSLARVEDGDPTVLEVELLPGEDALLAPEWVPWAVRLAEYQAQQAILEAERIAAGEDEEDDSDEDDESDEDADDSDGPRAHLHGGDLDGVDIDLVDDEDSDDDDSDEDDDEDDSDEDDDEDDSHDEDDSDDDEDESDDDDSDDDELDVDPDELVEVHMFDGDVHGVDIDLIAEDAAADGDAQA